MRLQTILSFAAAAALAACGGKPAPETPAPQTAAVDSSAIRARLRQDSIDAENRRRAADAARAAADSASAASTRLAQIRDELTARVHFDFDRADIKSDDQATLDRKAAILQANPGVRLRIEGNTDERGSDEYNLALGNRRAAAARRYLQNKGVDASRLDIASYGKERPIASGHDESAWAQNRRDDFVVTAGGDNLVPPQ